MSINDGILLVVAAFFASLLYAIRHEERRQNDRRQGDLPHPEERRRGERRQGGPGGALAWAGRALHSVFFRR